jgi:hypothetical protein
MSIVRKLPLVEVDELLWQEGWRLARPEEYDARHAAAIAQDEWIIEGLGSQASIPARIARATEVLLIDLPLWVHFALAAERQSRWSDQAAPAAGMMKRPPTMALFKTIWEVDQHWLPGIRELCREAAQAKTVVRVCSLAELDARHAELLTDHN